MTRSEFLKMSSILGIGLPVMSLLNISCSRKADFFETIQPTFEGKVLVIGAGAAGITAGYLLEKYNIDYEVIEASAHFGGRIKKTDTFADFPIDLGAEWIHADPTILARLLSDPNSNGEIETINYSPETLSLWRDGKLRKKNFFTNFYGEYKFKSTTWYDFFDQYMIPHIVDKTVFNEPISEIDYTGEKVTVHSDNGRSWEADKVIVTVPLTMLKQNLITFNPGWDAARREALNDVYMPDGIKVFMEFKERFYPDLVGFGSVLTFATESSTERLYYDAAFRKDSNRNIFALFTVGDEATQYTSLPSDQALIDYILNELDEIFDGAASRNYMHHIAQNWSKETFIQGSYSHYDDDDARNVLSAPIDNKIFFAGEAYAEDYATVHGASESAHNVVRQLLTT